MEIQCKEAARKLREDMELIEEYCRVKDETRVAYKLKDAWGKPIKEEKGLDIYKVPITWPMYDISYYSYRVRVMARRFPKHTLMV